MLVVAVALFFALAKGLLALARWLGVSRPSTGYRRIPVPPRTFVQSPAKPPWVKHEIIRLKALMAEAGTCRAIEQVFNRRFAATRRMTVGKTFVCELIRRHRYEIQVEQRRIKNARPKLVLKNLIWAIDLTAKTTLDGRTRVVLGVLEHASRAALWLEPLDHKSSWALILKLIEAIRRFGKPRIVRTDNESVFTSYAMRLALLLLGIRHHRTDPGCPWQNGRVERFFGTLKEKLDQLAVESLGALNAALVEFRFFYNHVRPHQNLGARTPAEAWDGLLKGYYLRR